MPCVLVADDEAIVRSTVATIIRRGEIDFGPVLEAGTGEEAIIVSRQMQPDVIFLDVKMPGLTGLEAMRVIRQEQPKTRIIMLTAYDEFTYSQEALRLGAVDYILKPVRPAVLLEVLSKVLAEIRREEQDEIENEQVSSRLKNALPQVEARLVQDLIHAAVSGRTGQERISQQLNKVIQTPSVMVVDVDQFNGAVRGMDSERFNTFCNLIQDIVRRNLPDPERTLVGDIRPGVFAVILSNSQNGIDDSRNRSIGQTIRQAIETSAPVTATIGIGRSYPTLDLIPKSYEEAKRAQWLKLFFGRNSVIHIDDLQKVEGERPPYPLDQEAELIANIRLGQRSASETILQTIVQQVFQSLPDPPEMVLTRLTELVVLISRAVISAGASSTDVLEVTHARITCLRSQKNRSEILEWAETSLQALMDMIPTSDRGSQMVERAILFMHENMSQSGLELRDVANAVHVSASHLAHLLKEKSGMSYVKYLTLLRVEEAKKLLSASDMTIATIAAAVGYEDSTYFHRVFRREVGMTPTAYRQQTHPD